jgi:rhodanese-related sulfurtransferase
MENYPPVEIDRETTRNLVRAGAQLVEVLSEAQYKKIHLASAVHIPLEAIDRGTVGALKRDEPVIVYCYDHQ